MTVDQTENIKRWKREHPDRVAEHTATFHDRHPGYRTEYGRRDYHRHLKKRRAQSRVTSAVHRGSLQKPSSCERCGRGCPDPRELHGHHTDYDKPLEVQWLCGTCHGGEHHH